MTLGDAFVFPLLILAIVYAWAVYKYVRYQDWGK
jgi:hypothetical protein